MSVTHEGGCACGAVRYRLRSDPLFIHCCHCLNCQRQTGSAFVINLLIETDRVELLAGDPQPVDVPRDDGSKQTSLALSDLPGGALQPVHASAGAIRSRRYARRPGGGRARRAHLHAVEAALGHAARVGSGGRGLLRHEGVVACRQPRAARLAHGGVRGQCLSPERWRPVSVSTRRSCCGRTTCSCWGSRTGSSGDAAAPRCSSATTATSARGTSTSGSEPGGFSTAASGRSRRPRSRSST